MLPPLVLIFHNEESCKIQAHSLPVYLPAYDPQNNDESNNDSPSAVTPPPQVSRHLLRHLCWFSLHFNAHSVCAASRSVELRILKMNNFPSLQRWDVLRYDHRALYS